MSDPTFEQFKAAIRQQESGGNPDAVSSVGALGLYQIMPANIGPWSKKYLGRQVSVAQYRRSPELQERLGSAVLHAFYKQYGARGAASAWYSGNPNLANNYGAQGSGPSIGSYVDSVMSRAASIPSGAGYSPPELGLEPLNTAPPPSLTDLLGTPEGADDDGYDPLDGTQSLQSLGVQDDDGRFLSLEAADGGVGMDTPDGAPAFGVPVTPATQGYVAPYYGSVKDDAGPAGLAAEIVQLAEKQVGTPYVWGGSSPRGFDCSGLVQWAYRSIGVDLPRVSADQARSGPRIDLDQLRPGDLVAWDLNGRNSGADHIAIYAGDGKIIEAPEPGKRVRVVPLWRAGNMWGVSMQGKLN